MVEVVALAGTLAHAGEHRQAFVRLGDVVDQLHHVDGLADAGAAEQADLAALGERAHQVDDLDAGFQQLVGRGLLLVARGGTVDFPMLLGLDRADLVLGPGHHRLDGALVGDVAHASEDAVSARVEEAGGIVELGAFASADDDGVVAGEKLAGDEQAEAPGGAGDEGYGSVHPLTVGTVRPSVGHPQGWRSCTVGRAEV